MVSRVAVRLGVRKFRVDVPKEREVLRRVDRIHLLLERINAVSEGETSLLYRITTVW